LIVLPGGTHQGERHLLLPLSCEVDTPATSSTSPSAIRIDSEVQHIVLILFETFASRIEEIPAQRQYHRHHRIRAIAGGGKDQTDLAEHYKDPSRSAATPVMLADTPISLNISLSLSIFTTQPQELAGDLQGAIDWRHPGVSEAIQEERLDLLIVPDEGIETRWPEMP
jgi:hypothetical protein